MTVRSACTMTLGVGGDHDAPDTTIRLVRAPDGSTSLVAIRNALAWVSRRPFLFPEDLD